MSLIAHYPLNGDTLDLSKYKSHAVNEGATVSTLGKIGSCYSFSQTGSDGINIPNKNFLELKDSYSMSIWVNPSGNHYHYNGTFISSGNWNISCWAFGISQDNSQIDVLGRGYNKYIAHPIPLNTWTHITCVAQNNVTKLYVNGVYVGEKSVTSELISDATNTYIGRETYANGYFSFNGKLNDLRIYDHALSEKEIKEISKAKVIHYTFDDFEEPTTNLWTSPLATYNNLGVPASLTATGEKYLGQTVYRLAMTPNSESALASLKSNLWNHGVCGNPITYLAYTKYSASIYWRPINKFDTVFGGTASNIGGWTALPREICGDGWNRYTQVRYGGAGANAYDNVFHSFYCPSLTLNETIYIDVCCPQIEEGKDYSTPYTPTTRLGKVRDISGYNNDSMLSLATSPKWTNDSAIGGGAYYFKGTTDFIQMGYYSSLAGFTNCTISFWRKNDTTIKHWLPIAGQSGSHYLMATTSGTGGFYHSNAGISPKIYKDGVYTPYATPFTDTTTWHHYVIKNVDLSLWTYIKLSGYGAEWNCEGYFDDIRIYSSELSDEDIKELYRTKMSLDSKGVLHTKEISESPNYFNPDLFFKWVSDPINQTPTREVVDNRDTWSVYPHWFHPQCSLNGVFKEDTQYRCHVTFKHETFYNGNFVPGGFIVQYTDGSVTYMSTHGGTGWYTFDLITSKGKTIKNIAVYYYVSFRVYVDSTSYIVEYSKDMLDTKGILKPSQISEVGITNGLVAWFPLDKNAKDKLNNKEGSVTGTTLTSGLNQGAHNFLYTTDKIVVNVSGMNQTNVSFSAWVNSNDITKSQNVISRNGPVFLRIVSSRFRFNIYAGTGWAFINGSIPLQSNTWYNLVGTYDGVTMKGYVNGVLDINTPKTGLLGSETNGIYNIGYTTGGEDAPFSGKIQDIRFYNRVLTPEEVKIMYNLNYQEMQITKEGKIYVSSIKEGL